MPAADVTSVEAQTSMNGARRFSLSCGSHPHYVVGWPLPAASLRVNLTIPTTWLSASLDASCVVGAERSARRLLRLTLSLSLGQCERILWTKVSRFPRGAPTWLTPL